MICAVKDRADLMQEAFLKSNRMGMLWATPTGLGIFLFAPDLVHFVIGSRWEEAIPVIQAFGLIAVFNQIAFNWTAFFRAHRRHQAGGGGGGGDGGGRDGASRSRCWPSTGWWASPSAWPWPTWGSWRCAWAT